jgi:hypothetical protein
LPGPGAAAEACESAVSGVGLCAPRLLETEEDAERRLLRSD